MKEVNSEIDLAWVYYYYGLALTRAQRLEDAQRVLQEAYTLFTQLQMPKEQAKAQSALNEIAAQLL